MRLDHLLFLFALGVFAFGTPLRSADTVDDSVSSFPNSTRLMSNPGDVAGPLVGPQVAETSPLDTTTAANDALWATSQCKGAKFLTQMSYSDYDVGQSLPNPANTAQSPWKFADLGPWGYYYRPAHLWYRRLDTDWYWGIAHWYRKIGVSDKCTEDGGQWRCKVIYHYDDQSTVPIPQQSYTGPDGRKRRMTGGHFYMGVTPEGGLMTQNRFGPRESAKKVFRNEVFPDDELPQLQKSSDLLWAMWEKEIPTDKQQNIQFFASLSITNAVTLQIMKRAMGNREITNDGMKFDMTTEEGKALLGTPNAAAFAHFLIQRKAQVGLKQITDAWVFHCDSGSGSACLSFSVKKLDAPVPRPLSSRADSSPSRPLPDPDSIIEDREEGVSGYGEQGADRNTSDGEHDIVRVHTMSTG